MSLSNEIVNNGFFVCGEPALQNRAITAVVAGVNNHRYLVLSGIYGRNVNCSSTFDSLPKLNLKSDVVCTSQIRDGLQILPGW